MWVADLGSFRKAAERLNTTQPNISSRIAGLEAILKVSLMDRDAGSVRLTTMGQELLGHARAVLKSTETLIEATKRPELYDGVLKLGVTEMVVHTWLREFLRVLKDRFPNIDVELTVDLSVNLHKELFARSIDLTFQNGPFHQQSSGNIDLGTYPLIWVASPSLALRTKCKVTIEDLANYPVLTHARDSILFEQVSAHFAPRRDLGVRLVPSSNLSACLHMTIDGMGIATLPAAMVGTELAAGDLYQIDYEWVPEGLHFLARYDEHKSPQFVVKAARIGNEVAAGFVEKLST